MDCITAEMNLEILEARYQGAIARSIRAVENDFNIRYGNRAPELMKEAIRVYSLSPDDKIKVRRETVDELSTGISRLMKDRLAKLRVDIRPIVLTWYYIGNGEDEGRLMAMLNMAGVGRISIEDYIAAGLLMHVDRSTVIIPEYLADYLSQYEKPKPMDTSIVYNNSENTLFMVTLEAVFRHLKPIEDYVRAFYGKGVIEALNEGLLYPLAQLYGDDVIINPLIDEREVKRSILRIKNAKARIIKHALSLYGKYVFDRELYCGINYMYTHSLRSLVAYICPWTPLYKSIIEKHYRTKSLVIVGSRFRKSMVDFLSRRGVPWVAYASVDLSLREVHVMYSSINKALFDDVLDILYESDLTVHEVPY